ncbi:Ankyrin repeat-containing domain [Balamuthia mandrillaris]
MTDGDSVNHRNILPPRELTIWELPTELLQHILQMIPPRYKAPVSRVCRSFRSCFSPAERRCLSLRSSVKSVAMIRWSLAVSSSALSSSLIQHFFIAAASRSKFDVFLYLQHRLYSRRKAASKKTALCFTAKVYEAALRANTKKPSTFELLQYLQLNHCPQPTPRAQIVLALQNGLDMVRWLYQQSKANEEEGDEWHEKSGDLVGIPVARGDLETLRWLYRHQLLSYSSAQEQQQEEEAAKDESRKQRSCWDESLCAKAAWNHRVEVLKWLRKKGCPWNEERCRRDLMDRPVWAWAGKERHVPELCGCTKLLEEEEWRRI